MLKNRKHSWIWRHEKLWRESKESENKERANGLNAAMTKPKRRKWKMQAQGEDKCKEKKSEKQHGLITTKSWQSKLLKQFVQA